MADVTLANILLVDDEPNNLRLLGSLLQQQGYSFEFATNGAEALRWVEAQSFDLIILDVMMPEMDGFEVCQRLKESPFTESIPVLFLTARTDSESLVQGLSLGAVDYISKPLRKEELLARVRTHLTLRRQKKELEELNASKDKFFSIIAHDLRNPLSSFIAFGGLLENIEELDRETFTSLLSDFRTSAAQLLVLLDNLLAWARIQRGMIKAMPISIDIHLVAQHNLKQVAAQAAEKKITVTDFTLPATLVTADSYMLDRIIHNLLTNAIKFTPAGGTIELNATQNQNQVQVSVSDSGCGIAPDTFGGLFEIGVKKSTLGTQGEKGTGLGLILCKEFVEKNGGRIWAENRTQGGAIFSFTLPTANLADLQDDD